MIWMKDDLKTLQTWVGKIDSDDIMLKEKIKNELIYNKYILHVLNNKELEEQDSSPGDYYYVNVLPYYNINPTQTHVDNFICFETQWDEQVRYNSKVKLQQIVFHIVCHIKTLQDEDTMLARHDLLAALVMDQFNWTNILGNKVHCVSNKPSNVDNDYVARTLIFEQVTDNSLVKTNEKGIPKLDNKRVVIPTEFVEPDCEMDDSV